MKIRLSRRRIGQQCKMQSPKFFTNNLKMISKCWTSVKWQVLLRIQVVTPIISSKQQFDVVKSTANKGNNDISLLLHGKLFLHQQSILFQVSKFLRLGSALLCVPFFFLSLFKVRFFIECGPTSSISLVSLR